MKPILEHPPLWNLVWHSEPCLAFRTLQGALDIVSQGNIKCAMDAEIEAAGRRGAAPSSAAPNKSIHDFHQHSCEFESNVSLNSEF